MPLGLFACTDHLYGPAVPPCKCTAAAALAIPVSVQNMAQQQTRGTTPRRIAPSTADDAIALTLIF